MIAATIRYKFPEDTDWDEVRQLLKDRAALYVDMPGLISKAFLFNPTTHEYGGNYVWESVEALHAFLEGDLFKAAVERFGKPEIHVHEIAAYLDRGKVLTVDNALHSS